MTTTYGWREEQSEAYVEMIGAFAVFLCVVRALRDVTVLQQETSVDRNRTDTGSQK
jgi:hypothetical protein